MISSCLRAKVGLGFWFVMAIGLVNAQEGVQPNAPAVPVGTPEVVTVPVPYKSVPAAPSEITQPSEPLSATAVQPGPPLASAAQVVSPVGVLATKPAPVVVPAPQTAPEEASAEPVGIPEAVSQPEQVAPEASGLQSAAVVPAISEPQPDVVAPKLQAAPVSADPGFPALPATSGLQPEAVVTTPQPAVVPVFTDPGLPARPATSGLQPQQKEVVVPEKKAVRVEQKISIPQQKPSELAIEEEELVGIDTVDLESPQGNWLFKRVWWERAEEKYEEIRALEAHIIELRMPFFVKRTDVDRTVLDPFYLNVAQDRGALEILLSDIAEFLAQEAQEGMLDEAERGIRDQLQAERETLEQLQKNIAAILSFDSELDAAIGTLMEQLNRVSSYEQEAWAHFKEIGRVLDDKKAREYVLKMKNIYRNIKEIEEYIQERFTIYFDQLIGTIKENAVAITATMDQLKERGIDLKEHLGQLKEGANASKDEEIEEAPRPKIDERGFFDRWIISPISSFFGAIWNGIVAVVQWPYNLIFGSKKPAPVQVPEVVEVVAEEPTDLSDDD